MNIKKIASVIALTAAFGLMACDDSSSPAAPQETPVSSEATAITSSNSSVPNSSAAEAPKSSATVAPTSSQGSIDASSLGDLSSLFGSEGMELPECTNVGDTIRQEVLGQSIPLVCGEDGELAPAGSLSDILDQFDDATLQPVLDSLGMTREQLEAFLKLFDGMSGSDLSGSLTPTVTCTGAKEDSEWKMTYSMNVLGTESKGEMKQTWNGNSYTEVAYSENTFMTAELCQFALSEAEEPEEGTTVERACKGATLVTTETTTHTNVSEEARNANYEEFQAVCKDPSIMMGEDDEE